MRSRAALVVAIVIGFVACGGDAEGPAAPRPERVAFDATVADLSARMGAQGIPGIALAAVVDGKLAYTAGLGVRDRTTREPVTAQTRFLFASTTKMIVAATVLELAQKGKVDLKGSASAQAPRLQFAAGPVTVHQLLAHVSGICDGHEDRPGPIDEWFAAHPLQSCGAPPGTVFNYSNINYGALGEVIQATSGQTFPEAVRTRVLVPFGMTATYDVAEALAGDHATAYSDGVAYQLGQDPLTRPMFQTFGGLMGSVTDLAHFVEGVLNADRALTPASTTLLMAAHTKTGWGEGWSYGYGTWALADFGGHRVVWHSGFYWGWSAWVAWVPDKKLGLVLLSNGGSTSQYDWLTERFTEGMSRFLGGAPLPLFPTPPSAWGKYVGTYVHPENPADTYQISLDGDGRAWVQTPSAKTELRNTGGDQFVFADNTVTFWPGETGRYDYLIFWDFVARRQVP